MSDVVIRIENLSKLYRLGQVGTGTLCHDLNRWWHRVRGKEDPYLKVGQTNRRESKGGSDYVWALKDMNIEIQRGERVGIIGRNGAGKSTLLKILSKVTGPTRGVAKIRGRLASLLEVGTGFNPELTGRENIYLNGAILGMTRREITNKLDAIVDFAGCERYVDTPVKRYSSGMMVRLGFAVAAHLEPDILIVDEVLAVGDAEFQKKALGKMGEVSNEQGRTILFVSHNMAAVRQLCSRALVIDVGQLLTQGETDAVVMEYTQHVSQRIAKDPRYGADAGIRRLACWVDGVAMPAAMAWSTDSPLALTIVCEYEEASECPFLDVTAYRWDGVRLFSVSLDSFRPRSRDRRAAWRYELTLSPLPLPATSYYFDLGVRRASGGPYVALWNHLCDVDVTSPPRGPVYPDSIVVPQVTGSCGPMVE